MTMHEDLPTCVIAGFATTIWGSLFYFAYRAYRFLRIS